MNPDNNSCVILFVKYPTPGRVKTRLAEQLGQKRAAEVYKNFVVDILATLANLNVNLKIFFEPADAQQRFQSWLGKEYSYIAQAGGDLGQKMKNAFQCVFADGFSRAVVIGSDSPDMPADFLDSSFTALDSHDAVIGPAADGGYYLIGFSGDSFLPEAFEQICWSTDRVFWQTINTLKKHRRKVHLLPQWYDVDTFEDLKSLQKRTGTESDNGYEEKS